MSAPGALEIQQLLSTAVGDHQAGRLAKAGALYRRVLRIAPDQFDALHLLGVIALQTGEPAAAIELIERAVAIEPNAVELHSNLGNARQAVGDLTGAIQSYQRAVALRPAFAEAHNNLANALRLVGDLPGAVLAAERALALRPDYSEAYNNLGNALREQGQLDAAVASYERALASRPDAADVHFNLGLTLRELGRRDQALRSFERAAELSPDFIAATEHCAALLLELGRSDGSVALRRRLVQLTPNSPEAHLELGNALLAVGQPAAAAAAYRESLALQPAYADAHYNLGNALHALRDLTGAAAAYREALAQRPEQAEGYYNLGLVQQERGQLEDALVSYQRALAHRSGYPEALNNLSTVLRDLGRLDQAVEVGRELLTARPDFALGWNNLGNALLARGEVVEAVGAYRRAVDLDRDYLEAHDNLLFALLYLEDLSPAKLLAEHRRWGDLHGRPEVVSTRVFDNPPDPERRLRVGYVSPDFRQHAMAFAFLPLLASHDRARFEITLYSNVARPDRLTEQLRGLADRWREVTGLSDAELAAQVQRDDIDLLVDLACHTAGNRLGAFVHQPAPVQITHSVLPSGLAALDYLLTDETLAPDLCRGDTVETLIRLPRCYTSYAPPPEAPPVAPLPARSTGRITFGSFNNLTKLRPGVVQLWAAILQAQPSSRLLLKGSQPVDAATHARVRALFEHHGIAGERVDLLPAAPTLAEHLALYAQLDVALDPFPFNGFTTTCEALWMGVPVVTLAGRLFADRGGVTLLRAAGLPELVASSPADYLARALALAEDLDALADLRAMLRPHLAASELCDGPGYARAVETAYRRVWRGWCAGPG